MLYYHTHMLTVLHSAIHEGRCMINRLEDRVEVWCEVGEIKEVEEVNESLKRYGVEVHEEVGTLKIPSAKKV